MSIEFYHMLSNSVGDRTKGGVNLISVHFKRLQFYNDDWDIEDILVFEAFIVLSRGFGGEEFFHQMRYLEHTTTLSKYKIRKSRSKLEKLGLISVERKGRFNSNIYKVNYETVKKKLDTIYRLNELKPESIKPFKRYMCDFFDYYKSNQQEYIAYLNPELPVLIDEDERMEPLIAIDEPRGEEAKFSPEFEERMKKYFAERGEELE